MSIYIVCAGKNPSHKDHALRTVQERLIADYGEALPGLQWRKLDLKLGGRAFADITGIKGLTSGMAYRARRVVDLWWKVKDARFISGRGYPEWVWRSVYEYLRVCGEQGRSWRLIVD